MISTLQSAGFTVTPCLGKAPFLKGWQTRGALNAIAIAFECDATEDEGK